MLATELKNNANKLAKWTAAALVTNVDMIKLGYVSRAHPRDPNNHVILGTQVSSSCVGFAYCWPCNAAFKPDLIWARFGLMQGACRELAGCRCWLTAVGALQICKPKDFASQINLNMDNCWGIIRALTDLTLKLDEGMLLTLADLHLWRG